MRPNALAGAMSLLAARQEAEKQARRRKELSSRQARARSVRGAIACVAFVMLLVAGWLFGGHGLGASSSSVVASLSGKSKVTKTVGFREQHRKGWIVYEMFDGSNCRYHRFDNLTGAVQEGVPAECEDDYRRRNAGRRGPFTWGGK